MKASQQRDDDYLETSQGRNDGYLETTQRRNNDYLETSERRKPSPDVELLQTSPDVSPMMKGLDAADLRISKDVELPKDPFSIENADNWQHNLNRSELPIGLDLRDQELAD